MSNNTSGNQANDDQSERASQQTPQNGPPQDWIDPSAVIPQITTAQTQQQQIQELQQMIEMLQMRIDHLEEASRRNPRRSFRRLQ
jgi:hypothetical protein